MKINIPKHLEKHLTLEEKEIANDAPFGLDDITNIVKYLKPLSKDNAIVYLAIFILTMCLLDGGDPVEIACRIVNLADIAKQYKQSES